MTPISVQFNKLTDNEASCYALVVEEDAYEAVLKKQFKAPEVSLAKALATEYKFTGKVGQLLLIPVMGNGTLFTILLCGIGKKKNKKPITLERYRRIVGTMIRTSEQKHFPHLAIQLPNPALFDTTAEMIAHETALIVEMAGYHFDDFITDEDRKITTPKEVILVSDAKDKKAIQAAVTKGKLIAQSVNKARHWIDLPPSDLTPVDLASKAEKIAHETGLKYTAFNEEEINQMGMGGLAAVSRGSERDAQFVILEYKTKKKDTPTICFVGKGITFDSGGLSLKPAQYMETMKEDMSGAAAVISVMQALAILKPEVNVIGITPLAENLPSGKATKPGDIIRFYNGKTAEVKNTDAEGRLILADALAYAVKHYKPDAIIDVATLTGACAYALGPFFSGLMSQHDELLDRIQDAAGRTGDRVWELPLHDDYKKAIRCTVADLCNIGSKKYNAGAITAAFFLQAFVNDTPWAHLDIAGTAFDVPDISYYRPEGATGAAVRLLIDIALNWQ
jgi:leucyl aminopeptidase